MRRLAEAAAVGAAAVAGLAALARLAPGYLLALGFPADEAWTTAVYARALGQTGLFAFNPGEPAPGVASPLWTALLAPIHLAAPDTGTAVLATKLLGFALHVAAALLLLRVLDGAGCGPLARLLGVGLVAFHPDLIAASVGGLEVPLAALAGCALLRAAQADGPWVYAAVSALVPLVRPDLAILAWVLPLFIVGRADRRRLALGLAATGGATAATLALVLGRDLALGAPLIPLPSAAALQMSLADAELAGFRDLLGQVPIADSSLLLLLAVAAAVWRLSIAAPHDDGVAARAPAAALLTGLCFCAAAFALHPPVISPRTGSFDLADQRHALAALPLIIGVLPAVLGEATRAWSVPARRVATAALAALLVASVLVHAPRRHALLAADAQSVDDLQVAAGRLLATASSAEVIWAVHPGAIRYFGAAHVVDLGGASQPEMAGVDAAAFLAAHPPRYMEIVPGRSGLPAGAHSGVRAVRLERKAREASSVSLSAEERWIVLCADPGLSGQFALDYRLFPFRCAPGPPAPRAR